MKRLLLILLAGLMLSFAAQAASFDCGKAASKVEKLICGDTAISKLDEELAAVYKTALQGEKQAEAIQQEQKQWIKERNGCADAACVKLAYETRLHGLSSPIDARTPLDSQTKSVTAPDKPGLFKLDQSRNDKLCVSLGRIINDDIKEYGETRFDQHDEFVKWRDVEEVNIDRGDERKYRESVERADVDINNDGVVDQVIRTKWSMRGVLNDALDVFPLDKQRIVIATLLQPRKTVMFNSGNFWMNRRIAKYGEGNYDWSFDDVASINLFQQNGKTYIVAHDYASPRNSSSHMYVFQLDKGYQPIDFCMFVKICPCGGCEELRGTGNQPAKTLPAQKWCVK